MRSNESVDRLGGSAGLGKLAGGGSTSHLENQREIQDFITKIPRINRDRMMPSRNRELELAVRNANIPKLELPAERRRERGGEMPSYRERKLVEKKKSRLPSGHAHQASQGALPEASKVTGLIQVPKPKKRRE